MMAAAPSTNMLPLPCNGEIENGFSKGNQEQCDHSSHLNNIGKPPTGMRHCISQATLAANSSALEPTTQILALKSSSSDDSGYVPVFRSGSYSEMGPKPYMEDEHICMDDLREHIGATNGLLSPGAFYGLQR